MGRKSSQGNKAPVCSQRLVALLCENEKRVWRTNSLLILFMYLLFSSHIHTIPASPATPTSCTLGGDGCKPSWFSAFSSAHWGHTFLKSVFQFPPLVLSLTSSPLFMIHEYLCLFKVPLFHSLGSQEGVKADMCFQSDICIHQPILSIFLFAHCPSSLLEYMIP